MVGFPVGWAVLIAMMHMLATVDRRQGTNVMKFVLVGITSYVLEFKHNEGSPRLPSLLIFIISLLLMS